jgi:glycosyltransferase involved in cell wall biosynthesis
MEVTGIELTGCDKIYAWDKIESSEGFCRVNLFPADDIERLPASEFVERLTVELTNAKPNVVVIPGWSERGGLAAVQWCQRRNIPSVMMSESTAWDEKRSGWKEWIKSRVIGLCSTALAGGASHADYLAQLGMSRDRVFLGYDAVDNAHFAERANEVRNRAKAIRAQHQLPEQFFLASARFVEKKNLPGLLRAYALYQKKAESGKQKAEIWSLVLLGDGPLKGELRNLIADLGLQDWVHLPGFKQYDELPVYYGLASAFVHASTTEQWGLVVNEAMASGLPVLVSNRCGCAQDLVREGVNGFTFDPCNVEQLAELMVKISAFNFPLSTFASASREIVAGWGPERFANGLQQAVEVALRNPVPKSTLVDRLLLRLLLLR